MSKKKSVAIKTGTSVHMPKPQPWDGTLRSLKKKAIDNEAIGVAKRLGAKCCVIIVMFQDGDMLHILDGGQSPIPTQQLYTTMMVNSQRVAQGHEGYIS